MSLQSDFARNRAIFEVLTGTAATADSAELRSARGTRGVPEWERAESASSSRQIPTAAGIQQESVQSFSLAYGSRHAAGMALDFKAPDDMDYPTLQKTAVETSTDPLENLYYRLEIDARMSSQLSDEEEF